MARMKAASSGGASGTTRTQPASSSVAIIAQRPAAPAPGSALAPLLRRTDAASRARANELAPELLRRLDEVRAAFVTAALDRLAPALADHVAAAGGDAAATAVEPVYDANGNLVSGTANAVGAAAVSSPFSLPEEGWGPQQWVMLAAGVLLLLAILLPPVLSRRLRSRGE